MDKANRATSRFVVQSDRGSSTVRDTESGRTLALKGYGALKGEYAVKKGINLSKPILAQALKKPAKSVSASTLSHTKRTPAAKKK